MTSIEVFLRANTDASVPERAEIVLMRVAFETLLNASHKTSDLLKRFSDHFKAELPVPPIWHAGKYTEVVWRTRWPKQTERPLDAWVQDFCAARNSAAHGSIGAKGATIWASPHHLLFSSWLFPLTVRGVLASAGKYTFSAEDIALRAGFEAFFAHDIFAPCKKDEPELFWSKIERSLLFPVWAKRLYPK
jgi:hypothetical protein